MNVVVKTRQNCDAFILEVTFIVDYLTGDKRNTCGWNGCRKERSTEPRRTLNHVHMLQTVSSFARPEKREHPRCKPAVSDAQSLLFCNANEPGILAGRVVF